MAAYTINTNTSANEELGLQYVVSLYNTSQAAQFKVTNPNETYTPITNHQYLKLILNSCITDYKRQYKEKLKADAANAVVLD